jgi:hypothetical protein
VSAGARRGALAARPIAAREDDARAIRCQALDDRLSDARRAPGDERTLVCMPHHRRI